MKIALIHYRLILRGGLETRLINYCEYFAARGDEVTVIVAKKSAEVQLPAEAKVVQLSPGPVPKIFRQRYFNYLLGRYMKRNSFDFSLSLGRTTHQQAVLCPGNHLGFLKAQNVAVNRLRHHEQVAMDRQSYQKSKIILAASEMMKKEVIELYGIQPVKVKVLYPPLNVAKFSAANTASKKVHKQRLGLDIDKKHFLLVSTAHDRKGLPVLLKAFARLKHLPVELLIAGSPEVKTNLPNVRYWGFAADPATLFAAADFTVLPAKYEPYGQVVAESLQCQTPVIISHMAGAAEVVGEHEGTVVHSLDPQVWAQVIEQALKKVYKVEPNFAQRNHLTLEDHMQKMLEMVKETDS